MAQMDCQVSYPHTTHVEEDLQRWADANPHLLNEGTPMLSLGMEIPTRHDHWIDNLFVDGNLKKVLNGENVGTLITASSSVVK